MDTIFAGVILYEEGSRVQFLKKNGRVEFGGCADAKLKIIGESLEQCDRAE